MIFGSVINILDFIPLFSKYVARLAMGLLPVESASIPDIPLSSLLESGGCLPIVPSARRQLWLFCCVESESICPRDSSKDFFLFVQNID